MPFITSELLLQIPVETTDGRVLGRVVGLEIDIDSQSILRYQVRPKGLIAGMLNVRDLLISRGQVKAITKEKMIVEGGVVDGDEVRMSARFARVDPVAPMSSHNQRE
jgi:sporulation protein YlmC with PRC-barrel domain